MLDPNNHSDIPSYEKSRNIVKEIIDFGVSQDELLKIIELISLELENRDIMLSILNIVTQNCYNKETKESIIL